MPPPVPPRCADGRMTPSLISTCAWCASSMLWYGGTGRTQPDLGHRVLELERRFFGFADGLFLGTDQLDVVILASTLPGRTGAAQFRAVCRPSSVHRVGRLSMMRSDHPPGDGLDVGDVGCSGRS